MWTRSQLLKTYMMLLACPRLCAPFPTLSENQATSLLTLCNRDNHCTTSCLWWGNICNASSTVWHVLRTQWIYEDLLGHQPSTASNTIPDSIFRYLGKWSSSFSHFYNTLHVLAQLCLCESLPCSFKERALYSRILLYRFLQLWVPERGFLPVPLCLPLNPTVLSELKKTFRNHAFNFLLYFMDGNFRFL